MEVNCYSFPSLLPTIIKRIAQSCFVAFDLELSGIPSQIRRGNAGLQTLQQRYLELKDAAETYHILQVGLTCVEFDAENQEYLIRPFNINLSPLLAEELGIERNFTYSTGAVDFLIRNGYDMDAPFKKGIPYMTRSEVATVIEKAEKRWNKANLPEIQLADDVDATIFMDRARKTIKDWQETGLPYADCCHVAGEAVGFPPQETSLSRFEKRLVHQLIRAEFPELQSTSRNDFIVVKPKDEKEQADLRQGRRDRLKRIVSDEIGFRWISEALAGADLSELDLSTLPRTIQGESEPTSFKSFARRMKELQHEAQNRAKVLVGHNCLLDLIYFYSTFYGPLPETLEEFCKAIHDVFPLIVDTKYLGTQGSDHARFRSSQLSQLEQALELKRGASLRIKLTNDQTQYTSGENFHEAGYDSFVTAKIFLKLAAKPMGWDSQKHTDEDDALIGPRVDIKVGEIRTTNEETKLIQEQAGNHTNATFSLNAGRSETVPSLKDSAVRSKKPKSRKKVSRTTNHVGDVNSGVFIHHNMFDSLRDIPVEGASEEDLIDFEDDSTMPSAATNPDFLTRATVGMKSLNVASVNTEPICMLPAWNTGFWRVYGNKLRVFGTQEQMCDIVKGTATEQDTEKGERPPRKRSILQRLSDYIS